MITKYEIKTINNEEVLYLYMDYSYEFANDLGNIKKQFSLIDQIKNYLKKMKLHFKGKYIVLMISGIATLTLACSHQTLNEEKQVFVQEPAIIEVVDYDVSVKKPTLEEPKHEEKVEKPTTNQITQTNPETTNKPLNAQKPTTSTNKPVNNQPTTTSTNKPQTPNSTTNTNKPQETPSTSQKPQENITNDQMVTIYRSNGTVETLKLETYLIGVVAAEMPASFNIEALKAQAIVARTYALRKIENGQVLTDTISTQVYKDNGQLKALWGNSYDTYYNKIKKAVDATKGMVITCNNQYIDAVFHSTSNGYTVDAKDVWGNDIPYLKSVASPFDISASSYLKTQVKEINDISKKLGILITPNSVIEITEKDQNGRVLQVNIDGHTYSGLEMRQKLGLRSTDFDMLINDTTVTFTTKGYGHGVGMSQYGAQGMANNGSNYKEIITHYYTGVDIKAK